MPIHHPSTQSPSTLIQPSSDHFDQISESSSGWGRAWPELRRWWWTSRVAHEEKSNTIHVALYLKIELNEGLKKPSASYWCSRWGWKILLACTRPRCTEPKSVLMENVMKRNEESVSRKCRWIVAEWIKFDWSKQAKDCKKYRKLLWGNEHWAEPRICQRRRQRFAHYPSFCKFCTIFSMLFKKLIVLFCSFFYYSSVVHSRIFCFISTFPFVFCTFFFILV